MTQENNPHQPEPSFSIITVTRNDASNLKATIESVVHQTYSRIEYIVIDGASSDNSVEIIENYAPKIAYWTSEEDRNLYQAMNKGLRRATGDFLLFLNAGDTLFRRTTLEDVAALATEATDFLYGDVMLVNKDREPLGLRSDLTTQRLPGQLTWKDLKYGMAVCHQGMFVRRLLAPELLENNLCADIDWTINILKRCRTTINIGQPVSDFLIGGLSKRLFFRSMRDRYFVLNKHYGYFGNLWNHLYIVLRSCVHEVSKYFK